MPCRKQSVESLAVIIRLDFLSISVADRGNIICIHKPALQHIGIFLKFQLIRHKHVIGETGQPFDRLHIPDSLELKVMDRHNGFHAPEEHIALELCIQIYRNETGLPVMAVNNLRLEID